MSRRKALFMGLILLNSGMYAIGILPETADSMQQRSGCREAAQGCQFPAVVFSEFLVALAGIVTAGIFMLDRGFRHEDKRKAIEIP